jgi:hypothetical protein
MAAMGLKLAADLKVDSFGVTVDDDAKRLDFPRAEADHLEGASGSLHYGIDELVFDQLHTRLDRTHWQAEAGSAGRVWLRTEDGAVELVVGRLELPHGVMIVRAGSGDVEILAPHALLADAKVSVPDLAALRKAPADDAPTPAPTPPRARNGLLQERLRFLDAVAGEVSFTIRVELDLPVLGVRRLDQTLRIPIKDGSLDFRALDKGLDWLEGAVLDIGLDGRRLAVKWGVPIIAPAAKDICWWELDSDAQAQAAFGRVPLRALADIRFPDDDKPRQRSTKKSILRSFTIGKIEAALSLVAPRRLDVAGGTILLGGDDAPGIVDLNLTDTLTHPPETGGPGALLGAIGVLDSTLKDVHLGSAALTVDRLHFGAIETIGLSFEGFRPAGVVATVNRITASNLRLVLGATREPATPPGQGDV